MNPSQDLCNRAKFGEKYVADADSPAQKWITRIGALLSRLGVEHKVRFQTIGYNSFQSWSGVRESYRRAISAAIEEIRLELELEGRDEIGQVYEAGKVYDFFTDLRDIVAGASTDIFIVDAYFDGPAFDAYLSATTGVATIRVLCGNYATDVAAYARKYAEQTSATVDVRKTRAVHDRVIFLDRSDCWIVGASIKDAGKKPTYLIPLVPQITPEKLRIYEEIWSEASRMET